MDGSADKPMNRAPKIRDPSLREFGSSSLRYLFLRKNQNRNHPRPIRLRNQLFQPWTEIVQFLLRPLMVSILAALPVLLPTAPVPGRRDPGSIHNASPKTLVSGTTGTVTPSDSVQASSSKIPIRSPPAAAIKHSSRDRDAQDGAPDLASVLSYISRARLSERERSALAESLASSPDSPAPSASQTHATSISGGRT